MENKHNLIIGGINYNEELDLLSEYLKAKIDGVMIMIHPSSMNMENTYDLPKLVISEYKKHGMLFSSKCIDNPVGRKIQHENLEEITFKDYKKLLLI